jgi:hypothetical protein
MMAYGFYNAVKEWCGFEDKKDEEFDEYLASMKVVDSDD